MNINEIANPFLPIMLNKVITFKSKESEEIQLQAKATEGYRLGDEESERLNKGSKQKYIMFEIRKSDLDEVKYRDVITYENKTYQVINFKLSNLGYWMITSQFLKEV